MSMIQTVCVVCNEPYTVGVVGTAMIGRHDCPVKADRDRYKTALEAVAGHWAAGDVADPESLRSLVERALTGGDA
jgi:hypothetical protein